MAAPPLNIGRAVTVILALPRKGNSEQRPWNVASHPVEQTQGVPINRDAPMLAKHKSCSQLAFDENHHDT